MSREGIGARSKTVATALPDQQAQTGQSQRHTRHQIQQQVPAQCPHKTVIAAEGDPHSRDDQDRGSAGCCSPARPAADCIRPALQATVRRQGKCTCALINLVWPGVGDVMTSTTSMRLKSTAGRTRASLNNWASVLMTLSTWPIGQQARQPAAQPTGHDEVAGFHVIGLRHINQVQTAVTLPRDHAGRARSDEQRRLHRSWGRSSNCTCEDVSLTCPTRPTNANPPANDRHSDTRRPVGARR